MPRWDHCIWPGPGADFFEQDGAKFYDARTVELLYTANIEVTDRASAKKALWMFIKEYPMWINVSPGRG